MSPTPQSFHTYEPWFMIECWLLRDEAIIATAQRSALTALPIGEQDWTKIIEPLSTVEQAMSDIEVMFTQRRLMAIAHASLTLFPPTREEPATVLDFSNADREIDDALDRVFAHSA